jgi:hypothetical protein
MLFVCSYGQFQVRGHFQFLQIGTARAIQCDNGCLAAIFHVKRRLLLAFHPSALRALGASS